MPAMILQPKQQEAFVLVWRVVKCIMAETRKLAAILVADVAGHRKLADADEDRTLTWLRAIRTFALVPCTRHNGLGGENTQNSYSCKSNG